AKICCSCSWLHFLKSWSLLKTRGDSKGIFARVAADITSADANIVHIAMDEDLTHESTVLRFVIQVSDRVHLANVMRRVRTNPDVMRIMRERSTDDGTHARHDGGMRIERERQDY
ncbi:ACT domain-containing protein, partial [Burkholderia multivorans]|uniref:ACT domain-containing protein n=1 Tax=Burkholderia multivorans TaxID=87883 RepID=UPI0028708369